MKKEKSWEYDDENNIYAVKELDKSSFKRGSHIPIKVRKVFECEDVEYGLKKEIKLIYEGNIYNAYIEREKNNKIRMVWTSIIPKMKEVFKNDISDFNDIEELSLKIPKLKFEKKNPENFIIDMKMQYNEEVIRELERLNIDILEFDSDEAGESIELLIKGRKNQNKFRKLLFEDYQECRICGMKDKSLLVASHIKAWRLSTPKEKINRYNGFLLCPNHDALFDKYLISFEDNGNIIISKRLIKENQEKLNINEDIKIEILEGNKVFLKEHRKIFNILERKYEIENDIYIKNIEKYNVYKVELLK